MECGSDRARLVVDALESLRLVCGRVAHDLGNLLTPILAYPPLIRRDLAEGCRGQELLDTVVLSAESILHIASQMRHVANRSRRLVDRVGLGAAASSAAAEGRRHANGAVEISCEQLDEDVCVRGDAQRIQKAVCCVVRNAIEALPGHGGKVVLNVARAEVVQAVSAVGSVVTPGEYGVVEVSDNGQGIPANVGSLIFEPFFTTRKDSSQRGAGLGLSIVLAVMQDHGGHICFESSPGGGTRFRLLFPRLSDAAKSGLA